MYQEFIQRAWGEKIDWETPCSMQMDIHAFMVFRRKVGWITMTWESGLPHISTPHQIIQAAFDEINRGDV